MPADSSQRCPDCGATLPLVDGLCPACVAKNMAALLGGDDAGGAPSTASARPDDWQLAEPVLGAPANRVAKAAPSGNKILPGYELGELLGRGGMGEVFRAHRLADGAEVAVKIAVAATAQKPALTERLAREAAALTTLEHPNVLRVIESGTLADGRFFLVTELAVGGSLAQKLAAGPLPAADVAKFFREIVSAVHAAHRAGILHRDLKPANVLLAGDGHIRLADFSLARLLAADGTPAFSLTGGDVFGTPYYLAPEARRGVAGTDERADIFSLGVLLHEMFTGRVPIGNYVPASRVAGVPAAVDTLIARCLAEDPAARPPDAATLLAEFERALLDRPARKNFLLVVAGLLLVAAIFSFVKNSHPAPAAVAPTVENKFSIHASRSQPWVNSLGQKFVPAGSSNLLFSVWETRRQDFEPFAAQASPLISRSDARWRHPAGNPGSNCPVNFVDFPAAQEFCAWLTQRERASGIIGTNDFYRLPNDVEWSLAAGLPEEPGGTPEDRALAMRDRRAYYAWGRTWPPPVSGIPANFAGAETVDVGLPSQLRSRDAWPRRAPVGSFTANEFGLFDMSGNVAEWCDSNFNRTTDEKVLRGGAWNQSTPSALNLTTRQHALPVAALPEAGFRVGLQLESK